MALADYFARNALAAAQVLQGFDEAAFGAALEARRVGLALGEPAERTSEGRALADLLVRLLARLYPRLSLRASRGADGLANDLRVLALAINPGIEIDECAPHVAVDIGAGPVAEAESVVRVGSLGWDAYVVSPNAATSPPLGESLNPFGAGAAACLGAANVFRLVFLGNSPELADHELVFSAFTGEPRASGEAPAPVLSGTGEDAVVLVGLGAVGNAAAWGLARLPDTEQPRVHLVDAQAIELSNLQRYILARREAEGHWKVDIAAEYFSAGIAVTHRQTWAEFLTEEGYRWRRVLVGLDTARDRRAVQAALPEWIVNAWTQPGDLGVSSHVLDGSGACLACLYLPQGATASEDQLVADALGVPDHLMRVRELLFRNASPPRDLLEAIAQRLNVPVELVLAFEDRPIRALYVEGICGGAVLPLGRAGTPRAEADVHVPLAHQSALAGVLAAARLARGPEPDGRTLVTRVDVMRTLAPFPTQPVLKDERGLCICQDPDYVNAYRYKYQRK